MNVDRSTGETPFENTHLPRERAIGLYEKKGKRNRRENKIVGELCDKGEKV